MLKFFNETLERSKERQNYLANRTFLVQDIYYSLVNAEQIIDDKFDQLLSIIQWFNTFYNLGLSTEKQEQLRRDVLDYMYHK